MRPLLRLLYSEQEQSPWLDNLQRHYITSGKLKNLVEQGVRGLTSNPTIFQKAIQASFDYDEQFFSEIKKGSSPVGAYWAMVVKDIEDALDIFGDVYKTSSGLDGYVSVEVDPSLAHDTEATISAARLLDERISRPNVMIKIPATKEGLPAITQMIAEGRNVNVTLIFSVERYKEVVNAFIEGLEIRVINKLPITDIASVASFFISRVDNEVDKKLVEINTPESLALVGTAAIAQAKIAYAAFQEIFTGEKWQQLARRGASVQRPLWASTSTKNPTFKDTLYVDELIGPHTVNTLPDATLEAFADHGTIRRTIDREVGDAVRNWDSLQQLGIDVEEIAHKLEVEGVQSFQQSFSDLIGALEQKAKMSK